MGQAASQYYESLGDRKPYALLGGMVIGQAIIWKYLYHENGPLRKPVADFVKADPKRKELVLGNMETDDEKGDVLIQKWNFWMVVGLHHGLGAYLAYLGMISKNINLFRLGLSFEIGEDVLHFAELVYSTMFPPGTEFFKVFIPETLTKIGLCCHHSIGLVCGSFVFVNIPDWWEAQSLVVLLLAAAVPQLLHMPVMPFTDLKQEILSPVGRVATYTMLSGSLTAIIARCFVFPPLAYACCQRIKGPYGDKVGNIMGGVCGLFGFFILLSTSSTIPFLKEGWAHLMAKPEDVKLHKRKSLTAIMMNAAQATGTRPNPMRRQSIDEL